MTITAHEIRGALMAMDHDNDDQWTANGAPAMDYLKTLLGDDIKRKEVTRAAPKFERHNPELPEAEYPAADGPRTAVEGDTLAGEDDETVTPLAGQGVTGGAAVVSDGPAAAPSDDGGDNDDDDEPQKSAQEAAQERFDEINSELRERRDLIAQAEADIAALAKEQERVGAQLDQRGYHHKRNQSAIQRYLQSQHEQRIAAKEAAQERHHGPVLSPLQERIAAENRLKRRQATRDAIIAARAKQGE